MRAAAVGINLTAANHLFLLEPLDSLMEQQAIGRVWRVGQKRMVTVHKWMVAESIEERQHELASSQAPRGICSQLDECKYLLGEWLT